MERRILLLILISFILYGCSFVDASPPIVHITYPGNNATVTGIITIRGTASDNVAIAYVEIKTGNSVWTRVNGTESWSYALDTNRISTTQVAISVRAIDTFQCVSPVITRILNIKQCETIQPDIACMSHINNQVVQGMITLTGTATDNNEIACVEVKAGDFEWVQAEGKTEWSCDLLTRFFPNENLVISLRAQDICGNYSDPFELTLIIINPAIPGIWQQPLYVSVTGALTNNGTSDSPVSDIHLALQMARMNECSEIRIAEGEYPVTTTLQIPQGLSLYGGFDPAFSGQNINIYKTMLKDMRINIPPSFETTDTFTATLQIEEGCGRDTIIEGLYIYGPEGEQVGGDNLRIMITLLGSNTSPTITQNHIYGGTGDTVNTVAFINQSDPLIENNVIEAGTNNMILYVNGLVLKEITGAEVVNNNFIITSGADESTGILLLDSSSVLIDNNTIAGNQCNNTTGIFIDMDIPGHDVSVENNSISLLNTRGYCDGIFLRGTINNMTISSNTLEIQNNMKSCNGMHIIDSQANIFIQNNTLNLERGSWRFTGIFTENSVVTISTNNIYCGSINGDSEFIITATLFISNSAYAITGNTIEGIDTSLTLSNSFTIFSDSSYGIIEKNYIFPKQVDTESSITAGICIRDINSIAGSNSICCKNNIIDGRDAIGAGSLGIFIYMTQQPLYITNNTIKAGIGTTYSTGIEIGEADSNTVIINNVISSYDSSIFPAVWVAAPIYRVSHNWYYNYSSFINSGAIGIITVFLNNDILNSESFTDDPLFYPAQGCLTINGGMDTHFAIYGSVTDDINGNARPYDGEYDAGAYEHMDTS